MWCADALVTPAFSFCVVQLKPVKVLASMIKILQHFACVYSDLCTDVAPGQVA